ncbi:DMT family transporter [Candidatus Tisiphia endosymbiont of Nemotelus uliginosus]|uniref:DMT family transporter n=1 Tax=Candidatus Tisiphia endosymbiont of Nemotelus uliginosus TaxID=3077926 RepID=UPI0035C8AB69
MRDSLALGSLLAILAAIALTTMNVFVKLIGTAIPIYEIIWLRFLIGLVLMLFIILSRGRFNFTLHNPIKFLLRTITALLGMSLLFMAVQKTSLPEALLLANTTPLIVPIFAFILTKAKMTKLGIIGNIIGFIGVGIALDLHSSVINVGALLAFASAFFVAISIIQIRLLGKTMDTMSMLFYYFLMSSIITSPFCLIKIVIPQSTNIIILLVLIGIVGSIYQLCSTLSYKFAPVRLTTPISYLNVLLGGVFEWLIWKQTPSSSFLIGCSIILVGIWITIYFGKSSSSQDRESYPSSGITFH